MTTTTTPIFMLKGDALVDYVNDKMLLINRGELTRTEMIKDAGYVYDSGKAMYVEFYTELLNARGVTPPTATDVAEREYDDLTSEEKDLYDKITEMLGEKWTHDETIEFMDELYENGINTASEFEDAYEYTHDGYASYAEKEFAEHWVCEIMCEPPSDVIAAAVDWQDVWDHNLRYDFCSIETVNGTFFFRNN
ncbi:antirestriction protein [Synechococcus phage DSL-LC07]|nr:antirestriction protein [Synechococcus phage DSL-LC07]